MNTTPDATPTPQFLEELERAFRQCVAEEYNMWFSFYGNKVNCSLSKRVYATGVSVDVKGEGSTITSAFAAALANFPKNPLDGGRWQSERIAGPVEEAQYTDVPSSSA